MFSNKIDIELYYEKRISVNEIFNSPEELENIAQNFSLNDLKNLKRFFEFENELSFVSVIETELRNRNFSSS